MDVEIFCDLCNDIFNGFSFSTKKKKSIILFAIWFELQKNETADSSDDIITVIEAPRQSDSMVELIKKLKPQLVVTGVTHFESVTSSAFELLLDTTRQIGCRLFLDISDQFELSSLPNSNGVLKYLAGTPLPPHAAIVCGLLKNKVSFFSSFCFLFFVLLFIPFWVFVKRLLRSTHVKL